MSARLAGLATFLCAPVAWAGADYDPASLDWNGGARLVALAREAGLWVRTPRALDLSALDRRIGILVLGPQRPVPEELRRFVRAGGRMAIADDVGASETFLAPFGFSRVREPRAHVVYGGVRHLALAFPRRSHILLWGVDAVVTNHPAGFRAVGRVPLLSFDGGEGLLYVVRDGDGELVVLGDPSLLVNQMLDFGDNAHFAQALLRYLVRGTPARPLFILHGAFEVRGALRGDLAPSGAAGLAADLKALSEEGAYGANALAAELTSQRPISGIFMAVSVFAGGSALLLFAALWGGTVRVPVRSRRGEAPGPPSLDRAGRAERARLAVALRREVEEKLRGESDHPARASLSALVATLPAGETDPLARKISARRLRRVLFAAEKVLGPLVPRGT
jgi:hypothetical protein